MSKTKHLFLPAKHPNPIRRALIALSVGFVLLVGSRFYRAHFGSALWNLDAHGENLGFLLVLLGGFVTPILIGFELAERIKVARQDWLGIALGVTFGLITLLLLVIVLPQLRSLLP